MNPNVPYATTFEALATLLGEHSALGFPTWRLHVRTIAFKFQGDWFNYATTAWMEEGERAEDKVTTVRECVALIDWAQPISQPLNSQELTKHLTHWRAALNVSYGLTFQAHINAHRSPSDLRKNSWPEWWSQLHVEGGQPQHPLPDGPFFEPRERIFGQDVPRLATQYFGDPKYGNQLTSLNEYIIHIPDRRVRISALSLEESVLLLRIENPRNLRVFWSVIATPLAGDVLNVVAEIADGTANVEIPFAVQRLETWVVLEDGYMLDRYEENPFHSTWGAEASLFRGGKSIDSQGVSQALAGGESDTVEFKPYIRLRPRERKAVEILRSASAFANAGGGDIYLGVSDEGEPVGVDADLSRDYGYLKTDQLARQQAYAKDLRKLINEGTAPNLGLEFKWHDVAYRTILQVRVPASSNLVHVSETGELYRRTGATNRKWRPIDAISKKP